MKVCCRLIAMILCLGVAFLSTTISAHATSFSTDFSSLGPGTSIYGNAAIDSGVLKLTNAVNSQWGAYYVNNLDPGQSVVAFNATFQALVGGGPEFPADGFSFNFANDLPITPVYAAVEDGMGTGLSICFKTYLDPAIDLKLGGMIISTSSTQVSQATPYFQNVSINLESDGTLDLVYGGLTIFSNVSTGYIPITDGIFGFGARTGGFNDNHWIDNLAIQTTTAPVPEPATMLLLGSGLVGLAGLRRKFKK